MWDARRLQIAGSFFLVLFVLGDLLAFWPSHILQRLEWISYDYRVQQQLAYTQDDQLIIIDIDEPSLAELGQWPWPRATVATLLQRLFDEYQVALAGIDVVFAEPEQNSISAQWPQLREQLAANSGNAQLLTWLPEQPPIPDGDAVLAAVLQDYPIVLGYYFAADEQLTSADGQVNAQVGSLPNPVNVINPHADIPWVTAKRFTANTLPLQQAANLWGSGAGFFDNPMVDGDGVFRRAPLLQRYDNEVYASLPLAMLLQLLGNPPVELLVAEAGSSVQLEGIDVAGFQIATDGRGGALVPWYGEAHHFRYISAADVLQGRGDLSALAGSIVILGTSAPGLKDLRSTPVGGVYPGVEINLSILAGMLQQNFLAEPPFAEAANLLVLLLLGCVISLLFPRLPALAVLAVGFGLLLVHMGINQYAWQQGYLLNVSAGIVLLALLTVWHLAGNFFREAQSKRLVSARFGQYVPPDVVNQLVATAHVDMAGEERELTVLFADIRGFTKFSEGVTAAELTGIMNELLTPLTKAIHDHHGTIDKYMGDAIMAFWGAPLADEQHAEHALQAAAAMQQALHEINQQFTQRGLAPLAMGIGVHSGLMNVGNMGSEFRVAYTVLGDQVNLGSRIESLTKYYHVAVLTSAETAALAPDWLYRMVDKARVKGKQIPVTLVEPVAPLASASATQVAQVAAFNSAFAEYLAGNFTHAARLFNEYAASYPHDKLAGLYIERLQQLIAAPVNEWQGVWQHNEK